MEKGELPSELFTQREIALFVAIERRSPRTARIYLGALRAFRDEQNADRLALVAHSLREMMRVFPQEVAMDVPMPAHRERLGDRVSALHSRWVTLGRKRTIPVDGRWGGVIDPPLRGYLGASQEFMEWFASHKPRRREEAGAFLARLDPQRARLPTMLELENTRYWQSLYDYFSKVAHHGGSVSSAELMQRKDALEIFLIDRLAPRTFEDMHELDQIIEAQ